jgi:CelD/BcsL family acetyltransferase involved in cellulose biosynthesis
MGSDSVTSMSEPRVELLPPLPMANAEWQRLGLEAGNPFSTWEWAAAWWQVHGRNRPQRILGCRDADGSLIGVVPLYLASGRPFRVLRLIGHGHAGQLGPVCRPEHREAVARVVKKALPEQQGWDACILERLDSTEGWPGLIDGMSSRVEPSPRILFETSDWDEFLASKSANFRQQTRRLERRLERDFAISFRLAEDPERLEQDVETFISLHETRWASSGGSTVFAGANGDFHRELAALALSAGWLRLSFLELDGIPRASMYCFRLGGADWYFQSGRDPAFDKQQIGRVLLNNCIREALEDGMSEFKLLLGEHDYKSRYATDEPPVETRVLARSKVAQNALRLAVPARRTFLDLRERKSRTGQHSDS